VTSQSILKARRSGFTLIEVLVTLILIGLLAAFVFPVIVPQLGAADPAKTATDLNDIKTAIEVFNTNVRQFPSDLEDLSNKVTGADVKLPSGTYTAAEVNRWNGPYFDVPILPAATSGSAVVTTGFDGVVPNALVCVDASAATPAAIACAANVAGQSHFVSLQVTGLDSVKFRRANDLMDPGEAAAIQATQQQQGKLRFVVSGADCSAVYYLATPFHN
jgi:general secretion pathway protein G